MHPPHKKNVVPPVANPIEQGCKEKNAIYEAQLTKKKLQT